jgi:cytochrome c2
MPEAIKEYYLMFKMNYDEAESQKIINMMWNLDKSDLWEQKSFAQDSLAGVKLGKGGRLFVKNCGACHSLEPPPRNGPPARGMTKNYRSVFSDYTSFQKAFISFTLNPSEKKAIMPHAVQEFGIMPKMDFEKQELEEIAQWLWDTYNFGNRMGKGPRFRGGRK